MTLGFLHRKAWPLGKAQPGMQQLLLQQAALWTSMPHPWWWKLYLVWVPTFQVRNVFRGDNPIPTLELNSD